MPPITPYVQVPDELRSRCDLCQYSPIYQMREDLRPQTHGTRMAAGGRPLVIGIKLLRRKKVAQAIPPRLHNKHLKLPKLSRKR